MMNFSKLRYPEAALADIKNVTLISFLDLSRWIAAGMVFVGHLRNPLFLGYSDIPLSDQIFLVRIWYFITGLHMEAVVVFFVLSGFLVGGLSCAKISSTNFRLSSFSIDRISRLYVAYLPALFLTLLLDVTGNYFFGIVGFWDQTHPMIAQKVNSLPFESLLAPNIFFGNLLMMQGFVVDSLGSNPPLWTISMEFWFYVIFGFGAGFYLVSGTIKKVFLVIIVTSIAYLLGKVFFVLMGLWFIGVGVAFLPAFRKNYLVLALIIFILVLSIARFKHGVIGDNEVLIMIKNYVVAVSFGFLIVSMRGRQSKVLESLSKINGFLADFSYSLYLIHFPVMLFLLAALYKTGLFPGIKQGYMPTNGVGFMLYGMVIIFVYLFAWIFSRFTEARTSRLRRYLKENILNK